MLVRAEWTPDVAVSQGIKELNATIIEAVGRSEGWRFQVHTQDRDGFVAFQNVFHEQGIEIELVRLFDLSDLVEQKQQSLTPEQRETLVAAYRKGYYDEPRRITQAELGEEFGISHRAVWERLRPGTRNLIGATLIPSGDASRDRDGRTDGVHVKARSTRKARR